MTARAGRAAVVWPAAIVVVGLVVATVVWVAAPFGDTLEPGETRDLTAPAWGRSATVVTPGGDVELVLGPPVERVDGQLVDGFERTDDLVSERGDRLVVVSWVRRVTSAPPVAVPYADPTAALPTVTLRVGDEEHELATTTGAGDPVDWQHRVFAVSGTPSASDVVVEVTSDGLTQTVRGTGEVERGVAAALTDPVRLVPPSTCALTSPLLPGTAAACTVGPVTLLPYVPSQGWVDDEDEAFAVVSVDVDDDLSSSSLRSPTGEVVDGEATATLDGAAFVEGDLSSGASVTGALVFRVRGTPEELVVGREFRLGRTASRPGRPVELTVRLPLAG